MMPSRSTKKVWGGARTFHAAPMARSGSVDGRPGRLLLRHEGSGRGNVVLVESPHDHQPIGGVARGGRLEERELVAARAAPARPEVHEHGRSLQRGEVEVAAVQCRAGERRRRLSDERRPDRDDARRRARGRGARGRCSSAAGGQGDGDGEQDGNPPGGGMHGGAILGRERTGRREAQASGRAGQGSPRAGGARQAPGGRLVRARGGLSYFTVRVPVMFGWTVQTKP